MDCPAFAYGLMSFMVIGFIKFYTFQSRGYNMKKSIVCLLFSLCFIFISSTSYVWGKEVYILVPDDPFAIGEPQLAPDTYVVGEPQQDPDGTYVDGDPQLAPDGTYAGDDPQLAPDGSYVDGEPQLAPDGTYVGGESDW